METGLLRVPLDELRTNDEQTVGSEYAKDGKVYRYVKNMGDTALVANGCCLAPGSSDVAIFNQRVVSCDAASAKSAVISMAGGVPMAAIIASGPSSNCFGWVQVKGPKRLNILFSTTALIPGMLALPSSSASGIGASAAWESLGTATSLTAGLGRHAVIMEKSAARSSAGGVASVACDIRCM